MSRNTCLAGCSCGQWRACRSQIDSFRRSRISSTSHRSAATILFDLPDLLLEILSNILRRQVVLLSNTPIHLSQVDNMEMIKCSLRPQSVGEDIQKEIGKPVISSQSYQGPPLQLPQISHRNRVEHRKLARTIVTATTTASKITSHINVSTAISRMQCPLGSE